ncbi:unnamed protein product [Calypogeia fissa]
MSCTTPEYLPHQVSRFSSTNRSLEHTDEQPEVRKPDIFPDDNCQQTESKLFSSATIDRSKARREEEENGKSKRSMSCGGEHTVESIERREVVKHLDSTNCKAPRGPVVYPRGGAGVGDGGVGGSPKGQGGGGSRAGTGASHGGLAQKDRLADLIPRAHWPGTIQARKNLPAWQTSTGVLIGRTHPDP